MQKIIIKEVTPSIAENKPTIIVDAAGARMSGFLPELKSLKPGDVIEAELEVKGKYTNILKFNLLEQAPATNGKPEMTPELWAEKDKLERWSRECNTSFMGIIDLMVAKIILPEGEVGKAAIDWALAHFKPVTQREPADKAPAEKKTASTIPGEGEDWPPLKNRGELFTRAAKFGLSPQDVLAAIKEAHPERGPQEDIYDLDEAWTLTAKKFASTIKAQESNKES